jgi:hypothetical protein
MKVHWKTFTIIYLIAAWYEGYTEFSGKMIINDEFGIYGRNMSQQ